MNSLKMKLNADKNEIIIVCDKDTRKFPVTFLQSSIMLAERFKNQSMTF